MKEVEIATCPFCGGGEFVETKVMSYGGVYVTPASSMGLRHEYLFATVCKDCGSVVRTYVQSPERLISKK